MKHKTIILTVILALITSGCTELNESIGLVASPPSQPVIVTAQQAHSMEHRFIEPDSQGDSAVNSAVMWARRYDELTKKNEELRAENQKYALENSQLTQKVNLLEVEIKRTQNELTEATTFLQDMQVELVNWKSDVLGFREEMRQSQAVELKALSGILRVLGAEPIEIPEPKEHANAQN